MQARQVMIFQIPVNFFLQSPLFNKPRKKWRQLVQRCDTYRLFWHDYPLLPALQAARKAVDPCEALYLTSKTHGHGKTESDPRVDPFYQRPANLNDRPFSRYSPLHLADRRRGTDFAGFDHGLGMYCWPLECVGTTWKMDKGYKLIRYAIESEGSKWGV